MQKDQKLKAKKSGPATSMNNSPRKNEEAPLPKSDAPEPEQMDVSSPVKTLTLTCEGGHPRPIDSSTPTQSIDVKLRDVAEGKR